MRIYLIGFMGCGKSTLGRKAAALMGMDFIDMDKYIEERYFKSIPRIFEEEGETGFREKERYALLEVSQFEDVIVATGGGAPCFFDNMEVMNQTGITVYVAPDTETLANRIIKSKTERPLVAGKTREELIAFIEETLKKRMPYYLKAKIILSNNNVSEKAMTEAIQKIKKD
jgi:shikimate kinase